METKKQLEYQKFLVENKFEQSQLNFDYLTPESKALVQTKFDAIDTFIKTNNDFDNYTEEKKDALYQELFQTLYDDLRNTLKENTYYSFDINGLEFNQLKTFVQDECHYDSSSIYYGIHLDATFFKRYDKKMAPESTTKVQLLSGETILLYEILCKKQIVGIKNSGYMFATTLRKLAECAKIYNHYDELVGKTFKSMTQWNMGLSEEKLQEFKKDIVKTMATEVIEESKTN